MSFDKSVELLGEIEGGYSNDAVDKGGPTLYGLSKASYPEVDFFTLTWEDAKKHYFRDFWEPLYADELDDQLAQMLFIFAVNTSARKQPKRAVKMLQTCVNGFLTGNLLEVDGVMGPKTVENTQKVCKKYPEALKMSLLSMFHDYYMAIVRRDVSQMRFLRGWEKRLWRSING